MTNKIRKIKLSDSQYRFMRRLFNYTVDIYGNGKTGNSLVKLGFAKRTNQTFVMTPEGYKYCREHFIS